MSEDTDIIKNQLKIVSPKLREYVASTSWTDAVKKIATQNNVPQEKYYDVENEIMLVLICLEQPKDLATNLQKQVGLDQNTARRIADSANGAVFSPVMADIKSVWSKSSQTNEEPQIKTYDSYEQMLDRQVQAMKPAGGTSDEERGTSYDLKQNSQDTKGVVREKPYTNQYAAGNDPYREPIE